MEQEALIQLITRSTTEGSQKALGQCPDHPQMVSKAQAYRTYGRSAIDRWQTEGLLHLTNKHFDSAELKRIAASSNRHTYLPVARR